MNEKRKRKNMSEKDQFDLTNIVYKESAEKTGIYKMTKEDKVDSTIQHGWENNIIGKQEQRKILHCFNPDNIRFEVIPDPRGKGNTMSDYVSVDKKILIEVRTPNSSNIEDKFKKYLKDKIEDAIDHCIEKIDFSYEGHARIAGLMISYLGGFANEHLILNIAGEGEKIDVKEIVTNYKNWENDRIDAIVIFIEAPPYILECMKVKESKVIVICKNNNKLESEIFGSFCEVIYV